MASTVKDINKVPLYIYRRPWGGGRVPRVGTYRAASGSVSTYVHRHRKDKR